MIPSDQDQTAKKMLGRIHGRDNQIDSRSDTLHESKAFGCLHKSFGSQGLARLNRANQRLGGDTRLDDTFFRLKRLMGMRFMCRRPGGSFGKTPGIRWKQHRRIDASLHGRNNRRARSQALHPLLNLIAPVRRHEIQFVQDQQICRRRLLFKGSFQVTALRNLFGIHHHRRKTFADPLGHRLSPEIQERVKG